MKAPAIAEWYQELMVRPLCAGEELRVTEFVDRLLGGFPQWGRVEARREGATRIVFHVGPDEVFVDEEAALATFRSVCARLAVVLGGADPGEQWFRIEADG
jgi:hypothetical protein